MAPTLRKTAAACITAIALLTGLQTEAAANSDTSVGAWNPPLEPPLRLVNQYRQPNSDYSAGHRGVDYLVEPGQPVLAPADGEVWFAGKVVDRYVLSVLHKGGYLSSYEPVCTDLMKGEPVFAGQEIWSSVKPIFLINNTAPTQPACTSHCVITAHTYRHWYSLAS